MNDTPPRAVWSGTFNLGPVVLRCHVLDNGQRIVDADSFADFMHWLRDDQPLMELDEEQIAAFATWKAGVGQ